MVMNQWIFEAAPDALHWGIVIAVSCARHGRLHAELLYQFAIVMSTIGAPSVRVVNQSWRWPR